MKEIKQLNLDIKTIIDELRSEPQWKVVQNEERKYYYKKEHVEQLLYHLQESKLLDRYGILLSEVKDLFDENENELYAVDLAFKEHLLNRMIHTSIERLPKTILAILKKNNWEQDYEAMLEKSVNYYHGILTNRTRPILLEETHISTEDLHQQLLKLEHLLLSNVQKKGSYRANRELHMLSNRILKQLEQALIESGYLQILERRYHNNIKTNQPNYAPNVTSEWIKRSFVARHNQEMDNLIRILFWLNRYKDYMEDSKKKNIRSYFQYQVITNYQQAQNTKEKNEYQKLYRALFSRDIEEDYKKQEKVDRESRLLRQHKLTLIELLIAQLSNGNHVKEYPYWGVSSSFDVAQEKVSYSFSILTRDYFEPLTFRVDKDMYDCYHNKYDYLFTRKSLPALLIPISYQYRQQLISLLRQNVKIDPYHLFLIYNTLGWDEKRTQCLPYLFEPERTIKLVKKKS